MGEGGVPGLGNGAAVAAALVTASAASRPAEVAEYCTSLAVCSTALVASGATSRACKPPLVFCLFLTFVANHLFDVCIFVTQTSCKPPQQAQRQKSCLLPGCQTHHETYKPHGDAEGGEGGGGGPLVNFKYHPRATYLHSKFVHSLVGIVLVASHVSIHLSATLLYILIAPTKPPPVWE